MIQPYLFFSGRCAEAIAFYQTTLGAKQEMLMRYSDSPEPHPPGMVPAGWEDKVMHASFRLGDNVLMASDGCGGSDDDAGFQGFSLSYTVADEAEAHRVFAALADGGKVTMPLMKTFWSPCFGMVTDRFGLGWMISVPACPLTV